MSYCPKCGNKVEENMVFCPRCGASLKGAAPPVPPAQRRDEKAEKNEKQEKNQNNEKGEKNEKGELGFVGYLIGGLILITIGLFSILSLSNIYTSGESWAVMLLIIGVIIIIGAVYVALVARRHSPRPN
ncbi:MAG: zinc-ribbon domain-containing protein [Candidatus Bathyarchaeota archaeon]|nr:zinc-ribbon domain-containing protein [Candidatus Bathyarchaeota archaeon]